jgi:hypothetical protein
VAHFTFDVLDVLLVPDSVGNLRHENHDTNDNSKTDQHVSIDQSLQLTNLELVVTLVQNLLGVNSGVKDNGIDLIREFHDGASWDEIL